MRGVGTALICLTALGLAAGLVLLPAAAWGQPAALVLETGGTPGPGVTAYTEIAAGRTVHLPGSARLVFLHYGACRTVTVVGGAVTVGAETFTAGAGASVQDSPTPCPKRVSLTAPRDTAAAGLVLRFEIPPRLSPRPAFVLTGPRAVRFAQARISRGDTTLLTLPLDGSRINWPAGAPALAGGELYRLTLLPAEPRASVEHFLFEVDGATPDGVTVIGLE